MQRRDVPLACAAASVLPAWGTTALGATWRKALPSSGETVPAVGLGTWLSVDVGDDPLARQRVRQALARFIAAGGGVIDSSPMYGSAERASGDSLPTPEPAPHAARVFTAGKIWTTFEVTGRARRRRVRLSGITTSHRRRHGEVARLLRHEPLDVLQITYNPADRRAEPLRELAAERDVAVIVNRPFDGGDALRREHGRAAGAAPDAGAAAAHGQGVGTGLIAQ